MTFAQWQSSKGITPWVFKKPHLRFGIEDVQMAFQALASSLEALTDASKKTEKAFTFLINSINKE
jgi:hypothetical protein